MDTIFKEQAQFSINMVDYHLLPVDSEEETFNVNIIPVDSITIVRRGLKNIVMNVRRSLKLEPVKVYELDVEILVMLDFVDDYDSSTIEDEEIIRIFKKTCNGLLSTIMARASVLISVITGANGQSPLVTQPFFLEAESGKA